MSDVQPIPDGYTAITPYLVVEGAIGYIDFLANAFGRGGAHAHPHVRGHARACRGRHRRRHRHALRRGPARLPGPGGAHPPLHHRRGRRLRTRGKRRCKPGDAEPETHFYGERMASVTDPCGIHWTLATHVEDVDMDTLMERMAQMGEE